MDSDALVLLIVAAATIASVLLTIVPLVPGTIFIPIGAALCALVIGWDAFPWWFWVAQVLLAAMYLVVDNFAQVVGVRKLGGSRQAMVGGAIGVFVGPIVLALFTGPLALFIGPPVGAVAGTVLGERWARRGADTSAAGAGQYSRLGVAAFVAYVMSTGVKLGLVGIQIALLVLRTRAG